MNKLNSSRSTQAKLLLVLSIVCGIGISPFIMFRAMQDDWAMVVLDIAIVIGMAVVFFYVYKTNRTKYPSIFFLTIAQVGAIISFYINGGHMVNWVYPSMLTTFFVVKPRIALTINFAILLIYLPKFISFFNTVDIVVIIISVSILNIIAFRFSEGLRVQEEGLKKIASEDYLTETGNRRALNLKLDKVYDKLKSEALTASLIILDLDHFKKINDIYGHLVGDDVLVNLSRLMKQYFKTSKDNRIYRYGGEEFLIICENTNSQEAHKLAEGLRKLVKNSTLIEQSKITISLGVAEYIKGESISDWIHRVDLALYKAKNEGRDRSFRA